MILAMFPIDGNTHQQAVNEVDDAAFAPGAPDATGSADLVATLHGSQTLEAKGDVGVVTSTEFTVEADESLNATGTCNATAVPGPVPGRRRGAEPMPRGGRPASSTGRTP